MEFRQAVCAKNMKRYTTQELREEFLIRDLFVADKPRRVYTHVDRVIVMGFSPVAKALDLEEDLDVSKDLGVSYFLERRELGCINVGGKGSIEVDGEVYEMKPEDGLYIGKEVKKVVFKSEDASNPAKFYTVSAPAHTKYPNTHVDVEKAAKRPMGDSAQSNKRVIYQFIHPDVMQTCQLVMGLTKMDEGNVWNTMPVHTHERRMEVYFYFDIADDQAIFHLHGEPTQTRHIVMHKDEAVISPSWSIHSAAGTSRYSFIWAMAGENQAFDDMDHVATKDLR